MKTICLDGWNPWMDAALADIERCPAACRAQLVEALTHARAPQQAEFTIPDRGCVAVDFLLWASTLPGWSAGGKTAVEVVDAGPDSPGVCGACGYGEAVDEEHVPVAVRAAIGALCDAFDENEIGQVDQGLIDALRPFRAPA